jgi:uncharacterized protein
MKTFNEDSKHSMKLARELLAILACPRCKGEIEPMSDGSSLVCRACRLKYPVVDGIPLMLIEEAEKYNEE